jgi:hypothetical protein
MDGCGAPGAPHPRRQDDGVPDVREGGQCDVVAAISIAFRDRDSNRPGPAIRSFSAAAMRECGDAGMRRCTNAVMRECGDARMRRCTNAVMHECGDARMR